MTEVKHTPGPWKIRASHEGDGPCIYSAEGYGIGKTWDVNGAPENAANAHLIAAAPEMYEALIQARGALRLDHMVDQNGEPFGTTVVALKAITAALDKAEGRAP